MGRINRSAAASAFAAAFSLAAAPALAHDHHWHHHDGIDSGDVFVGALLLGGLAAVASAASNHGHHDQTPPVPDGHQGYIQDGTQQQYGVQDRAADACVAAVERGGDRVDSVDSVTPGPAGWDVSGVFASGAGFGCRVDDNGRVDGVNVGGPRAYAPDGQYDGGYGPGAATGAQALPRDGTPPPGVDDRPLWHDPAQDSDQPDQQPDHGTYGAPQAQDSGQTV